MIKLFNWPKPKETSISDPIATLISKLMVFDDWGLITQYSNHTTIHTLTNYKNQEVRVVIHVGFNFSPVIQNMKWMTEEEREALTYHVWKAVRTKIDLQNSEQRQDLMKKLNKC